jgi:hypothetical protein
MAVVNQYCESITVNLSTGPDLVDISVQLATCVSRSGIGEGVLSVFIFGSTGSLTTIEYEPGVVADLKEAINRLAPPEISYAHEEAWHDGTATAMPRSHSWAPPSRSPSGTAECAWGPGSKSRSRWKPSFASLGRTL